MLALAAGCTVTETLSGAEPSRLLATIQVGDRVRATTARGELPEFEITAIEAGGLLRGSTLQGQPIQLRVTDIEALRHRRFAAVRTAGLVAVVAGAFVVATASCEPSDSFAPLC